MSDGLFEFETPVPDHPDTAVAREEISRYYEDRAAEARAALTEARERLARCEREQVAWTERGEITAEGTAGTIRMEAVLISSHSTSRYTKAAFALIKTPSNRALRAEVEVLQRREEALRRWLTARGYDLGAMALPAPDEKRSRTRRG